MNPNRDDQFFPRSLRELDGHPYGRPLEVHKGPRWLVILLYCLGVVLYFLLTYMFFGRR